MWGFNFGVSNDDWNEMNNDFYFFNYLAMTVEHLVSERETVQAIVDDEIAREFNENNVMRTDNESSMLKGQEAQESLRIFDVLKKKYANTLRENGGVDEVIKELENFIVGKLGDEDCRFSVEKRKYDKKDPLEVRQLKTALRAILDEAPSPPSHFESFLHPNATGHIGPSWESGTPNGREMLAYFWLAASDPEMPLAPDDEQQREQCIRAEKMIVVAGLSDIRRGHNDGSYSPVDADFDDCACGPGTWGRIAKMHVHNMLTKMQLAEAQQSPAPKFKNHIEPFIIEAFKERNLHQQLEMVNALNNQFVSGEKSNDGMPFETFDKFLYEINQSHQFRRKYVEQMATLYGKSSGMMSGKYLDRNHLKLAHIIYTEELFKMQQAPRLDLVNRLQSIAIANLFNPVIDEVKNELGTHLEVKKAHDDLVKIVQSQKATLKSLKNINNKIQNLDRNADDFSLQLEALKKEKNLLSSRFSSLIRNKEKQIKLIESIAKSKIVEKIKPKILQNLVVSTTQVDNMVSQLLSQEKIESIAKNVVQNAQQSVADAFVSSELNGITLEVIKKHHAYRMFAQSYVAQKKSPEEVERLTNVRVLKAILLQNNPVLDADKMSELIEEWQNAYSNPESVVAESHSSKPGTTEPAIDVIEQSIDQLSIGKQIEYAQRLAGAAPLDDSALAHEKLSDIENPQVVDFDKALKRLNRIIEAAKGKDNGLYAEQAELAKISIGKRYYQFAVNIGSGNSKVYNDAIAKAQSCGINCDLGLDPEVVKKQGVDQAVINPNWFVGIRANCEDIEELFKLNSAAVSTVISDLRYEELVNYFSNFSMLNSSSLQMSETALETAADNYFAELDKESPDQFLLQQKYQALQSARRDMLLEIEEHIMKFKQNYLLNHSQYFDADSAYLRRMLMDADLIEQKLEPALHPLYTSISNRMKQISKIDPLYVAHDTAISKAKRDCLDLVEGFSVKVADKIQILESRHPKKSSLAGKQLIAFKVAQANLENLERSQLASDLLGNKLKAFQELGASGIAIANQLDASLNQIGQANTFRRSIRTFKNAVRSLFRKLGMNVDQVVPKELTRAEVASLKMDAEQIDPIAQNNTIRIKQKKINEHNDRRSKAVLSSFAKNYQQSDQAAR